MKLDEDEETSDTAQDLLLFFVISKQSGGSVDNIYNYLDLYFEYRTKDGKLETIDTKICDK